MTAMKKRPIMLFMSTKKQSNELCSSASVLVGRKLLKTEESNGERDCCLHKEVGMVEA